MALIDNSNFCTDKVLALYVCMYVCIIIIIIFIIFIIIIIIKFSVAD